MSKHSLKIVRGSHQWDYIEINGIAQTIGPYFNPLLVLFCTAISICSQFKCSYVLSKTRQLSGGAFERNLISGWSGEYMKEIKEIREFYDEN